MTLRMNALRGMLQLEVAAEAQASNLTGAECAAYARANPESRFLSIAGGTWFDKMSKEKQEEYKKEHPHSRYTHGFSPGLYGDHGPFNSKKMANHHARQHNFHMNAAQTATDPRVKRAHLKAQELHGLAHKWHKDGKTENGETAERWGHDADRASWELKHAPTESAKPAAPKRVTPEGGGRVPTGRDADRTSKHLIAHHGAKFKNEYNAGYHQIHHVMSGADSHKLHDKLVGEGWRHSRDEQVQAGETHPLHHYTHPNGGRIHRLEPSNGSSNTWGVNGKLKE